MLHEPAGLRQRLRSLFLDELDENLTVFNRGLLALESSPDAQLRAELVHTLFRAAHSLKGAAHAAAVAAVVSICDRLEEAFAGLRDGVLEPDESTLAPLFEAVDALANTRQQLRGGSVSNFASPEESAAPDIERAGQIGDVRGGGRAIALNPATSPSPIGLDPGGVPDGGSVRLPAHKLDALLNRTGELNLVAGRLDMMVTELAGHRERASAVERRWRAARATLNHVVPQSGGSPGVAALAAVDKAWSEANAILGHLIQSSETTGKALRRETSQAAAAAQDLRMQPFAHVCENFDRTVRDLAKGVGKQARLSVDGTGIELDRVIGGRLREPLLHLVRNAVDHGIEPPEERARAGKPPVGQVRLSASLAHGGIEVTVADDGGGIALEALRTTAMEQGRSLPDDDLALPFLPGLSTAPVVTDVSGRGVGLDAVRARIETLGGAVQITTEQGKGTHVVLSLPLTLSSVRAVLVSAAGEMLALPVSGIRRLVTLPAGSLRQIDGRTLAMVDGEFLPAVPLAQVLGFAAGDGPLRPDECIHAAVVAHGGGEAALLVDRLDGEQEVVTKNLPDRIANLPGALGATILPGGQVAVVVNSAACVRLGLERPAVLRLAVPADVTAVPHRVLLVEDTLTTRVLERSILESAGYEVVVAVNGEEAWQCLQEGSADIVVSDVHMPQMDGFSLCEAIRRSPRLAHLPIVLVTSLSSDEDRRRGLEAGANAYIVKSAFEQGALLAAIGQLL